MPDGSSAKASGTWLGSGIGRSGLHHCDLVEVVVGTWYQGIACDIYVIVVTFYNLPRYYFIF